MDEELFIQIVNDELEESLAHYSKSPQDIIYQQDNDPKYTWKKDPGMVQNPWIHSPTIAYTVSRPWSNWTSLETHKKEVESVWNITKLWERVEAE